MHEWALAEAVLVTADKTAAVEKMKSVSSVTICLGELQQIDRSIFKFALRELGPGYKIFSGSKMNIVGEKAKFKCRSCGEQVTLSDIKKKAGPEKAEYIHFVPEMVHVYMKCGKCASPDFDIVQGRGVFIKSITGKR